MDNEIWAMLSNLSAPEYLRDNVMVSLIGILDSS